VVFISLAVFPPVLLNTYEGIRSVGREYVEVAKAFEFSRWQLYRRVILPAATPQIFTGLRLGMIYAWLATIGAEYFLKAGPGIGNIMIDGREHFKMDQVIVGVAIVGIVGYLFLMLTSRLEARLLRWRHRSGSAQAQA
jgi:sulfonate transport system permease protein